MTLKHVLFFCFLLTFVQVYAQYNFNFDVYSREQGLSDNFIFSIAQDTDNYIWATSSYGINRFDGRQFKTYVKTSFEHDSISRNDFNCTFYDRKGRLWFGSYNGTILQFDKTSDRFLNYSFDFETTDEYTSIMQFYQHDNSPLLALTTNGLYVLNETTQKFELYLPEIKELQRMYFMSVQFDSQGNLWCGTSRHGLLKIDVNIKRIVQELFAYDTYGVRIPALLAVHDTLWYVGTSKGVYSIHPNKAQIQIAQHCEPLENIYITSLALDKTGTMWIGTNYNGLWVKKPRAVVSHIADYQTSGVKLTSINTIFCDDKNIVWIGTQGNGMSMYNPAKNRVWHTTIELGLGHNVVSAIEEDAQGRMWIATDGGGISVFSSDYNRIASFSAPTQIPSNSVLGFAKQSVDDLWLCTWGGGLAHISMNTFSTKMYTFTNAEASANLIKSICFYNEHILWLGTYGNGILEFDIRTGQLVKYTKSLLGKFVEDKERFINHVIKTPNGDMWAVSFRKLYRFSSDTLQVVWEFNDDKANYFPGYIHSLAHDANNNILLATNKGMLKFDAHGKYLQNIADKVQDIKHAEILSIQVDSKNNYWIASTNGLYVYNETSELYKYVYLDNYTKGNFFTPRAVFFDKIGRMHFGTMNGVYAFIPDSVSQNQRIANFLFSNLYISYKKVEPNVHFYDNHISQLRELRLTHKQNIWGVSFDAISFDASDAIKFAYMLEDFDKNWNFIGNKREITFTNIPHGTYMLKVKAWINNPEDFKEIDLLITILPPWWKTWWFRLSMFVLIIAVLFSLYYLRIYNLEKQKKKLTREVVLQTKEILEQKQFIQEQNVELKQANDTKNYLFSIIAHDLRNSFTSLHGFTELLHDDYDELPETQKKEYIGLIKQAAVQIYSLFENLLSWSRSQSSSIQSNPIECNVGELLSQVVDVYSLMAQEKQIHVQYDASCSIAVFADRDMIITALRNIYNNALKFTPENGSIVFNVHQTTDNVQISISDSGVGMSANQLQELFRLRTSRSRKSHKQQGSGLGLIVSKEFIEQNNGSIHVESTEFVGTVFTIQIPRLISAE